MEGFACQQAVTNLNIVKLLRVPLADQRLVALGSLNAKDAFGLHVFSYICLLPPFASGM